MNMAFFGNKEVKDVVSEEKKVPAKKAVKKTSTKEVAAKKETAKKPENKEETVVMPSSSSLRDVIIRPYITEKSVIAGEHNAYVFEVRKGSTKQEIKRAIYALYKHTPRKVNIARKPITKVRRKKGMGRKSAITKAYVYLKKGDTIEIV